MRILVVEDDVELLDRLKRQLTALGFGVDVAEDGEQGLFAGLNYPLDAAIVDVGLPIRSGLDVIRQWRARDRQFPVVVLTARGGWRNRVEGLEAGADDYVDKPFSFEEVVARLQSVMRRVHGWATPEITCGPFTLNTSTYVASVEGRPLDLTTFEFRLLEYLMLRAGQVLSGTELTEHMYDESVERESNVISHFICRLRRKLDPTDELKPIDTIYGGGYRFRIPRGRSAK
jgi:two-component system response regulator PhoP